MDDGGLERGKIDPVANKTPPSMPAQPPAGSFLVDQERRNAENLKILSICHYVHAGLIALFACFPIIHLVVGGMMVSGNFAGGASASERGMIQVMGGFFVVFSSLFILVGWALAVANFLAAGKLGEKESRTFCMIVAGVNCMNMPLGTILGIFTVITLSKQPVNYSPK